MNMKNMKLLRQAVATDRFVKEKGIGLNMRSVFTQTNGVKDVSGNECGTVACLAGITWLLMGKEVIYLETQARLDWSQLNSFYGLESRRLFHPPAWLDEHICNTLYTKPVILAALDIIIEEGKVDYDVWFRAEERVAEEGRVQA